MIILEMRQYPKLTPPYITDYLERLYIQGDILDKNEYKTTKLYKVGAQVCDWLSVYNNSNHGYPILLEDRARKPEEPEFIDFCESFRFEKEKILLTTHHYFLRVEINEFFNLCIENAIEINELTFKKWLAYKSVYPIPEIQYNLSEKPDNLLELLLDKDTAIFFETYNCFTHQDALTISAAVKVCIASILNTLKLGYTFKKCSNCGNWFIPYNRSDALYCDRVSPQNSYKTCKEYGAQKAWEDKLLHDEVYALYRKTYMKLQMLTKRNPDIKEYAHRFSDFKSQHKQWRLNIKDGCNTKEQLYEWLKKW